MEGQLQLRREDEEQEQQLEDQSQSQEQERSIKMKELPLESSPHLKCTDLENYKVMLGYATAAAQGLLCLDVDNSNTNTVDASLSPRDAAAIDRKLKWSH